MSLGYIQTITRHPVKSMRGEQVSETKVMSYGLYGDRSHVLMDETRENKFFTITQFPELVKYTAKLEGTEKEEEYPPVAITSPKGTIYHWEDEQLQKELEEASGRAVSFTAHTPEYVPFGAIEEENILLITDASLQKLAEIHGKDQLEAARFRPNIVLSLKDQVPFAEEQWIGRRLLLGDHVEIEVKRPCERCMIITVDPETGERDARLLKTVVKERDNLFGVYCSVKKTGIIRRGDPVKLLAGKQEK